MKILAFVVKWGVYEGSINEPEGKIRQFWFIPTVQSNFSGLFLLNDGVCV